MTLPTVRLAGADDLPDILLLERSTAEAPHWREAIYGEYLAASTAALQRKALWVADLDGSVAGFAAATCFADQAELDSMAVANSRRRMGIGSLLLDAVGAWAQHCGADHLLLEVRAANGGAQALYLKHGFSREGVRRGYYSHPADDAVLMRLNLVGLCLLGERTGGTEL